MSEYRSHTVGRQEVQSSAGFRKHLLSHSITQSLNESTAAGPMRNFLVRCAFPPDQHRKREDHDLKAIT